jgi:L-amino acid N-acyltransferase YncA
MDCFIAGHRFSEYVKVEFMDASYSRLEVAISPMTIGDWPAVRAIYVEGIRTGDATFEKHAPDWEHWSESHLKSPRLVVRVENKVAGWAALSAVSRRKVYAGVAEVSIYLGGEWRGRGIGQVLLPALVKASEQEGIWTLQAGIFPENVASIAIHKTAGFRIVGTRERLGCMDGKWRDVVLMERRSDCVGI